ncbi:nucleotidyltransferase family protein [Thalassotalea fonticola]|uniref:Nucleotidyltransferase family protein n=1 Tax=Thalassotalea fonticola TaxID=3065649 RepID=A0ABZ0GSZ3_9GAMM|nr:nucleotidyltransferase family protein [Colwelliaceae bacterium S1-1]
MTHHIALVLAAGFSKRYGSDKRLSGDKQPLILQTLDLVCQNFNTVYLVHRHLDDTFLATIKHKSLSLIPAPKGDIGLGNSLAAGIKGILKNQTANKISSVSIFLADMPYINSDTIKMLLRESVSSNIVRPMFQNQAGHPVCFGTEFLAQLSQLCGDLGAVKVIKANNDKLHLMKVDDSGTVADIDKPGDWQSLN